MQTTSSTTHLVVPSLVPKSVRRIYKLCEVLSNDPCGGDLCSSQQVLIAVARLDFILAVFKKKIQQFRTQVACESLLLLLCFIMFKNGISYFAKHVHYRKFLFGKAISG